MSLQALIEKMRELTDVHEQAYQLANAKKDVLIKGDIDSLAKIVQQENGIIRKMSMLEAERQQIVIDLVQQLGIASHEPMRLSDLLASLPNSPLKEELQDLFRRLSKLLLDLQQLNELNQQLIENSLAFVNYSLELFTDTEVDQVYQKPDAAGQEFPYQYRRSIFDTKA